MGETKAQRKNAADTRGRPFKPGNSGRPKGARNRTTQAAQALLDGEAETLTRKAIELALSGDMTALRLCLDRIVPPRRDRPVEVELPPPAKTEDLPTTTTALLAAVAEGQLTPSEAKELAGLLDTHIRAVETADFENRLQKLEAQSK